MTTKSKPSQSQATKGDPARGAPAVQPPRWLPKPTHLAPAQSNVDKED